VASSRCKRLLNDSGHAIPPMSTCGIPESEFSWVSLEHGACPPDLGVVGPIASASSSKPLTAKPDAVNGFGLAGKVAVKCVEAELPAYASKFSRVTSCSMRVRAQRLLNSQFGSMAGK
jgi:hypothetical protein